MRGDVHRTTLNGSRGHEQTRAVDPQRLGNVVTHVTHAELIRIDRGLRLVLDL